MKLSVILTVWICFQVIILASGSRKSQRERAKERIRNRQKALRDKAKGQKLNAPARKLEHFLSSNPATTERGDIARTQLEYLKERLDEWTKERQANGESGDPKLFIQSLQSSGDSKPSRKRRGILGDFFRKLIDRYNAWGDKEDEEEGEDECPFKPIDCAYWTGKYRTADGTCNNQHSDRHHWGAAGYPQPWWLKPDFADGVSSPRVAANGKPLPSARVVSNACLPEASKPSSAHTLLLMVFGQLLDHDIVHTPTSTFINDQGEVKALFCGEDNCDDTVEDCFPIHVPEGDKMRHHGTKCLYFARSEPALDVHCRLGPRRISNLITSFVDASMTYGSNAKEMEELRDHSQEDRGRLKMSTNPVNSAYKDLLPFMDNKESDCSGVDDKFHCFKAGDVRQNEQISLTAAHTIMARLHNLVEENLHKVNSHWDSIKLFAESRRVVGAIWQHFVYDFYLPIILGKNLYKYKLHHQSSDRYDKNVDASIMDVFSTCAFRFGHTMVTSKMPHTDGKMDKMVYTSLTENFFNPQYLYKCPVQHMSGVDSVMMGVVEQQSEGYDRNMARELRHQLFTDNPPHGLGFDLAALNIQRGRDHGIRGYAYWREECGLSKPKDFHDLLDYMSEDAVKAFKKVYSSVNDIDLFPAGLAETPQDGAFVGPTFACIIGHQFKKLKFGDRFFFTFQNTDAEFTHDQIYAIKKYSMARWLCDTLDNVGWMQNNPFLRPYDSLSSSDKRKFEHLYKDLRGNKRWSCDEYPEFDFSVFREGKDGDSTRTGSSETKSSSSKTKSSKSSDTSSSSKSSKKSSSKSGSKKSSSKSSKKSSSKSSKKSSSKSGSKKSSSKIKSISSKSYRSHWRTRATK